MPIIIDATYENGILKPDQPLPLQDQQRVRITVQTEEDDPVGRTYGLIHWTGDTETLERIACDPEFGIQESP